MPTILVVDDSPVSQRVLSYILRSNGYKVLLASQGHEALQQLYEVPIDLIIADLMMPELDGLSLLRILRNDTRFRDLPLVMLTSSSYQQDEVTAHEAGVTDFLTKPAGSRELLATVERLLAHDQ